MSKRKLSPSFTFLDDARENRVSQPARVTHHIQGVKDVSFDLQNVDRLERWAEEARDGRALSVLEVIRATDTLRMTWFLDWTFDPVLVPIDTLLGTSAQTFFTGPGPWPQVSETPALPDAMAGVLALSCFEIQTWLPSNCPFVVSVDRVIRQVLNLRQPFQRAPLEAYPLGPQPLEEGSGQRWQLRLTVHADLVVTALERARLLDLVRQKLHKYPFIKASTVSWRTAVKTSPVLGSAQARCEHCRLNHMVRQLRCPVCFNTGWVWTSSIHPMFTSLPVVLTRQSQWEICVPFDPLRLNDELWCELVSRTMMRCRTSRQLDQEDILLQLYQEGGQGLSLAIQDGFTEVLRQERLMQRWTQHWKLGEPIRPDQKPAPDPHFPAALGIEVQHRYRSGPLRVFLLKNIGWAQHHQTDAQSRGRAMEAGRACGENTTVIIQGPELRVMRCTECSLNWPV